MVHVEQQQVLRVGDLQQCRAHQWCLLQVEGLGGLFGNALGNLLFARFSAQAAQIIEPQLQRCVCIDHLHGYPVDLDDRTA
ncbi:hypothetical protein D3C73_1541740 [compost metagenome]